MLAYKTTFFSSFAVFAPWRPLREKFPISRATGAGGVCFAMNFSQFWRNF